MDKNAAQEYMRKMYKACGSKLIEDGIYGGRTGHLRLAREIGVSLNDFDPAGQAEIRSASYSVIYVRACSLKPILDANEWIAEMLKGQKLAERKSELAKNSIWIDGLMRYATERQIGFETHQSGALSLNPERRNERTRELIRGAAELYGSTGKAESLINAFDDRLRTAQSSLAVELTSKAQQLDTVLKLFNYARDLAEQPYDTREQMLLVSDHLEDMVSCLSWDASGNGLYPARDWLDRALPRITAQQNILFTHIMLGPEIGPAMNDFVGGAVTDSAGIADTCLYTDLTGQYPDIETWPAICTVYRGGYGRGIAKDATELDLGIMRRYGDKFLDLEGISVCRFPAEVTVKTDDAREQSQQNTMQMGM